MYTNINTLHASFPYIVTYKYIVKCINIDNIFNTFLYSTHYHAVIIGVILHNTLIKQSHHSNKILITYIKQ